MRRGRKEEYRSGKTADLRNVISEIQKVDQETMDLKNVVEEAQRLDKRSIEKVDPYATCRVLFISVLDKILLIILLLGFLCTSFFMFKGNLFSPSYGFWSRFYKEFLVLLLFVILYFLFNWYYYCLSNTMMCVTRRQIYIEKYLPFWSKKKTIPLEQVNSISTINFFFIFRCVVIFESHHYFPVIFFTWNNQKFKDRVVELMGEAPIGGNPTPVSLIQRDNYYLFKIFFVIFGLFLFIVGTIRFFGYIFSPESNIAGNYAHSGERIVLKKNGTCDVKLEQIKNVKKCTWKLLQKTNQIRIDVQYSKSNYLGNSYERDDSIRVSYKDKVLIYNDVEYQKK